MDVWVEKDEKMKLKLSKELLSQYGLYAIFIKLFSIGVRITAGEKGIKKLKECELIRTDDKSGSEDEIIDLWKE